MQCDYDIRQLKIVGTARLNRYRFIKVICWSHDLLYTLITCYTI